MLTKEDKEKIIKKFQTHENDTGSPQVQIAILTEEIKDLTNHLQTHKHDNSSRRGLLKKVAERKKLLKYLQKEDEQAFVEVSKRLNLKIKDKLKEEEENQKTKVETSAPEEAQEEEEEAPQEEADENLK